MTASLVQSSSGGEFAREELKRMIAEKDYPALTNAPEDRRVAEQLLELLGGHVDKLKVMYLHPTFTDEDLPVLLPFDDIGFLQLQSTKVTDRGMKYVGQMHSLRSVWLPPTITDVGIEQLRGLQLEGFSLPSNATNASIETLAAFNLRGLGLSRSITDEGVRRISEFQELGSFYLNDSQVSDAAFLNIGSNRKLWIIDFGTAPNITPEVAKHLQQLPQLAWLVGPPCTNDRFLELLASIKTITHLELADYAAVTDDGVKHLAKLERLHDLSLGPNITDAGMPYIGQLKWLANLDLTKTQVTGEGLAHLGPYGPSKLELSDSVSDEGLANISKFTRLSYLILNGEFSDACFVHLPKRLHQVKFSHTKVTDAGLNVLRRERPGLIIEVQREDEFSKLFDQRSIDLGRGTAK